MHNLAVESREHRPGRELEAWVASVRRSWAPGSPATGGGALLILSVGEFVDCLQQLLNGQVLVRVSDFAGWTSLAGAAIHFSFEVLEGYGLIQEFQVLGGWGGVRYFHISPAGREFAVAALALWQSLPLGRRVLLRLLR